MNKICLITIFIFTTISSFAQLIEPNKRNRSLFVSGSTGISSTRDFAASFEFGTWGIKKPTSYSITFDAVKNIDEASTFSYWIGIKPYYTFYESGMMSYMVYFAPKVRVNNGFDLLIENGLSMNATISNRTIIGTGLAFQSGKNYTLTPSVSIGLVYMLQK